MIAILAEVRLYLQDLEKMRPRARDLRPAMDGPVDDAVSIWTKKQFETEGGHGGSKWAPLKAATIAARKRPGHGRGGIGHDTGRMWASLVKSPAPEGVVHTTNKTYKRWTSVTDQGRPYPDYFDKGRKGQVARPIYPHPLPANLVSQVEGILTTYIVYGRLSVSSRGSKLAQVRVRGF